MPEFEDSDLDGDDSPTVDPVSSAPSAERANLPVLTLIAHPDVGRIGQRACLFTLLLRREVLISRTELEFSAGSSATHGVPLLDTSVSRSALSLQADLAGGGLILDPRGMNIQIDQAVTDQRRSLSRPQLERGVLIGLSSRVGLLLQLEKEPLAGANRHGLVGESSPIRGLRATIDGVAVSRAPVLILGESGSGKELVAAAIHRRSDRANKPFVPVNAASLGAGTAGSQLFGHRKGAFTGADARHPGLFEQAQGGSLFLDEIGDASAATQTMLLRALESSRILALGDEREREVDVRVLAATELDLRAEVDAGRFRPSLAQRLAGVVVRVPPLRDRRADVPSLLLHFLTALAAEGGTESALSKRGLTLSTEFMFWLLSHDFPGNVRELRNIAQQLWLVGHAQNYLSFLSTRNNESNAVDSAPSKVPPPSRDALLKALGDSNWSPAKAARLLGVPNSTVHYWMRQKSIARRATDLSELELELIAKRFDGDVEAMSRSLAVSTRGLRLRMARARHKTHDTTIRSQNDDRTGQKPSDPGE